MYNEKKLFRVNLWIDLISDVDECVDSFSVCGNGSICENTIGSYLCLQNQCPPGYTLSESGTNCIGEYSAYPNNYQ